MSDNIRELPNLERDELTGAFTQFVRMLPVMAEHAVAIAQARRALFDAYVGEGFSEAQALELCKGFNL